MAGYDVNSSKSLAQTSLASVVVDLLYNTLHNRLYLKFKEIESLQQIHRILSCQQDAVQFAVRLVVKQILNKSM